MIISVRQPWAWLIIHGAKSFENRTWSTKYRGLLAIHASRKLSWEEYDAARILAVRTNTPWPALADIKLGGIIGTVQLVDIVTESDSPWFTGPFGWVLADPKPMEFFRCAGKLGLFDVICKVPTPEF